MSDNNYTKGIPISLTINEKDLKEFKAIVDKIEKGQEADLERLKEIVKTGGTEGTATSATTTSATVAGESATGGSWWAVALSILSKIAEKALKKLKEIVDDSVDELHNVVDYSRLSNKDVREQAFEFGFSPAENYAYSKAMDVMGLSGFEDLYFLTEKQWKRFNDNFEKFSERYSNLYDEGFFESVEDYNYRLAEWEEEMKYEFLEFFVDNKELIMGSLDVLTELLGYVTAATRWLLKIFGGTSQDLDERKRARRVAEIINTQNGSTTKNTTVTFSPVFNGVGSETKASLDTSLSLVKEQILLALE